MNVIYFLVVQEHAQLYLRMTALIKRLFFILLLFPSLAYSAPTVSSVTGTISDGSSVTIAGTGFGTKSQASPLLWDDFETGTTNTLLNASPRVGNWHPNNPAGSCPGTGSCYVTSASHSGAKSSQTIEATPTGAQYQFQVDSLPDNTYYYQSFWFRYNQPSNVGGVKFQQAWSDPNNQFPIIKTSIAGASWCTNSIWPNIDGSAPTAEDYPKNSPFVDSGGTCTIPQNTWHHFEGVFKESTVGGSDGRVSYIINGYDYSPNYVSTANTRNQTSHWVLFEFFDGIVNQASSGATIWVDDAYLDNTWQRVMVCDSSTYSGCTDSEVQVPTAWNNTSITVTLQKGGLTSLTNKYLYVFDSTNTPNTNGFLLGSVATGQLNVAPNYGPYASGKPGSGNYTPTSQVFTLTNTEANTINWTASKTQSWVTLSATSGSIAGTLQNPSASSSVTVSINSGADSLGAGSYSDTVTWTNTSDGAGNTTTSVTLVLTSGRNFITRTYNVVRGWVTRRFGVRTFP